MNFSRKAAIFTLGCRLNQADSALLSSRLHGVGWVMVEPFSDEKIDLLIINSCSVTGSAAQKSRQAARKFHKQHPESMIIVTGCSAEADKELWDQESGVDVVITNPEKRDIGEVIANVVAGNAKLRYGHNYSKDQIRGTVFHEAANGEFPFRSRAFIKIQEGCNNFCSYCIVPYTRGPERSRSYHEIIEECKNLLQSGFPEIVLTGVNVCAYEDNGRNLNDLLHEICALEGDFRIRLSSTEPHPSNIELLQTMSSEPKICRFLHLSLQHGDDVILKSMNRKYNRDEFANFVHKARELMPDIHLGTDVIVGYPGETEAYFANSCSFVEQMDFANMHIFSYSPRQGTVAAGMKNQVKAADAKERYGRLKAIADNLHRKFMEKNLSRTLPVIFEEYDTEGYPWGWSDNYIRIRGGDKTLPLHKIISIQPEKISDIKGELVLLGKLA